MNCQPPHPESLTSLHRLREEIEERGDECLALLLAGVEVYTSIGREWELLEIMRKFAHDAEDMVRNTPSAAELRKLYEREDPEPPALEEDA
jgi:hypothetical protein